uniref:Protein LONGIFOLIA 1 isoform X2 n=1 Tax=Rhizophora mucronata TaxID=61149 RepID=A0A2P2JC49_RHIMU
MQRSIKILPCRCSCLILWMDLMEVGAMGRKMFLLISMNLLKFLLNLEKHLGIILKLERAQDHHMILKMNGKRFQEMFLSCLMMGGR